MVGMDMRFVTDDTSKGRPGQRVRARRIELGLSQTELAAKANLTQPTISSLEKGRSHTSGSLASIAKALGVSALWLETGLGDMIQTWADELPGELSPAPAPETDSVTIPLLECKGSCGNGRMYSDVDYSPITISTRLLGAHGKTPHGRLIALYADGDSMSPFIAHGDIMLFDTGVTEFRDGGIYLIDTPDGLRVKRVNRRVDGRVVLRSDNPDKVRYPDEEYSADQASQLDVKGRFALRIGG